ncbi:hypothetical protein M569_01361 [Genlisea aurea]|uniref:Uncharacterized protein n=1 Tax=Genlisea aurea TaxID=192259 RepID=S8ELA8_9LAMI|nr:hypothetical protein M569_01361 [Genlisea aurea]
MAGQLPGIESARRRRCHGTTYGPLSCPPVESTRRPFYCLYSTTLEFNSPPWETDSGENSSLDAAAMAAKERLDQKLLKPKRKCPSKEQYRFEN